MVMIAEPGAGISIQSSSAVLDAIRSRRSHGRMQTEIPSRELIDQILEAASWAPNHQLTQPWRFFVLSRDARLALADAIARHQIGRDDLSGGMAQAVHRSAVQKVLRAPVIIVVAVEPADDPRIPEMEEICVGAAAIQNLILAAHELELAAVWRTGDACAAPQVKGIFGLDERTHILGFVYLGYPDGETPARAHRSAGALSPWYGWTDIDADLSSDHATR